MKTPKLGTTITKRVTQTAGGVTAHIGSQMLGPQINEKEPAKGQMTALLLMGIVGAFGDEAADIVDPRKGYAHAGISGYGDGLYTYSSTVLAVNGLKKLDKDNKWKWNAIAGVDDTSIGNRDTSIGNAAHSDEETIVRDNGFTEGANTSVNGARSVA